MQRSNQPLPTAPTRPNLGGVPKGVAHRQAERSVHGTETVVAPGAKDLPPNDSAAFGKGIDATGFRRLIDIAGPTTAKELIANLQSDLTAVSQKLLEGFATHDWGVLSRQSHILIGLAGIIGAKGLLLCAQALNIAAGTKDLWGTDALQAPLMSHLSDLIHFVTQYPQPLAKHP